MPKVLQPKGWAKPSGYSNGIVAQGTLIFLAGQIGWNVEKQFTGDDFESQARQALENVVTLLHEAGAQPQNIVRMTWYVVDKHEYLSSKNLGKIYKDTIGDYYPAMTLVEVKSLLEDRARVEIEVTAVL